MTYPRGWLLGLALSAATPLLADGEGLSIEVLCINDLKGGWHRDFLSLEVFRNGPEGHRPSPSRPDIFTPEQVRRAPILCEVEGRSLRLDVVSTPLTPDGHFRLTFDGLPVWEGPVPAAPAGPGFVLGLYANATEAELCTVQIVEDPEGLPPSPGVAGPGRRRVCESLALP